MTSSAYLLDWGCHRRRLIHSLNRPTVVPLRDQNIFLIQENENFLYQTSKADFTVKTFEVWESSNKQSTEKLTLIYQGVKRVNQSWQRHGDCCMDCHYVHSPYRPCPYPHRQILVPPSKRIRTSFSQAGGVGGLGAVQGTEGVYRLELVTALTRDQTWQGVVMFRCVQCLMLYVVCRVYVCMFWCVLCHQGGRPLSSPGSSPAPDWRLGHHSAGHWGLITTDWLFRSFYSGKISSSA